MLSLMMMLMMMIFNGWTIVEDCANVALLMEI